MRSTQVGANGRKSAASALKGGADRTAPARREPRRAGRPTSAELERRKAKVMQVATTLFVQHGYAATSLVDIAKAAGVATRTLYQHFGDKEAIFLEVVTARETGAVFPQPSIPDGSLFDGLLFAARYVCDVAFRPRSVDLMRLMIAESRRFPDFMSKLSYKTFARFQSNVAVLLDEIIARNLAPQIDTKLAAALFVDLILGSRPLMMYAGWVDSRPTDAELEAKINLFLLGEFGPDAAANARNAPPAAAPKAKRAKAAPARS